MQMFTGFEYMLIAAANAYGLDRTTWDNRLDWAEDHKSQIIKESSALIEKAKEPILLFKTMRAINKVRKGRSTGFICSMDATASGIQILGTLAGCESSAKATNLIDTGDRQCAYEIAVTEMNKRLNLEVPLVRDDLKKPVMTYFYGSSEQPKMIFGEDTPELKAFYDMLKERFTGAYESMEDIKSCHNPEKMLNNWTLPDGHTAYVPVTSKVTKRIEVDEFDHKTFSHTAEVAEKPEFDVSLPANITHSIDGYVVREVIRRSKVAGFDVATIHDAFFASPNHLNEVRKFYRDIMVEIAESSLLQDILRQVTDNSDLTHTKLSNNLGSKIAEGCEYALS